MNTNFNEMLTKFVARVNDKTKESFVVYVHVRYVVFSFGIYAPRC